MKCACVFAAAAFAAVAVNADTVKAARAEIASNSVNLTTECRYYRAWFAEGLSKEECEAIMDRNIAAFTNALEPILIVLIASIVGFVAIAILMAVFNMSKALG